MLSIKHIICKSEASTANNINSPVIFNYPLYTEIRLSIFNQSWKILKDIQIVYK